MKFNYLNYLLNMSIQYRCYKEVTRAYIERFFDEVNEISESDFCTNCGHIKQIRSELRMVMILLTNMLNGGELITIGLK